MLVNLHLVHSTPTPHNNYFFDQICLRREVRLFRHYFQKPTSVPGRPWKNLSAGDVGTTDIRVGVSKYFDLKLIALSLYDSRSVFFIIGWNYPLLVLLILIRGLMCRPMIMWDDGPTEEAVEKIGTLSLRHTIKRLLIWCINRSSGTYFHTGSLYHDKLVKMGVEREKLVNLPFFVKDTLRGKNILTEVKAKPVTGVKILAGGRLIHRKGYDLLIAALHHLVLQNLTSWNLTLVGSGPEECNLEKMIERFKLTPYVTKISWAEPSEFNQLIENCDVFVAPARFDPFPTTIISALRASKLVIATEKVGSAVEFIEDGVNGLLVPENSIDGLQDALSNAVSIESLRNSLSKNADKRVALWPVTRGVQLVIDAVYDSIDIKS